MNALILDGSHDGQSSLTTIQQAVERNLSGRGWGVEAITLREMNIKSCIGCFRCWHTTPGICSGVRGDDAEKIIKKVVAADLVVHLTPLTFGGYSSELKKIIERFLGILQPGMHLVSGETHHLKRYEKYASTLSLAVAENPRPGEADLFKKLVYRNSLNFYPPRHRAEVFLTGDADVEERLKSLLEEMEL
jgi:multimeric flavodoxin WrbA